jgi:superfamily II DNA or RNA helicase/diadenosine tetraphosphate (Ap4A) HIT family hydrolase/HKD family nuclease
VSPFLEIPRGEWIAANDLAFAVHDRFPVSPGHTLVITRRVVPTWWDATRAEQHAVLDLIDTVKRRLDAERSPDGYNVGLNAGRAAGQTVDHLHVHVIPRYHGDVADPRGGVRHVIPALGNYLAPPSSPAPSAPVLVTPLDGRMHLELVRCLIRDDLDRIDLLVSFVMRSGLDLVAPRIDEALARGAQIRLLTTDYLRITDTAALGFFLDRLGHHSSGGRLEARVFSDPATSFHPKAYLFWSSITGGGVAFVGSSNLSRAALTSAIEWNLETRHLGELRAEFDRLWGDRRAVELTREWLGTYDEQRRQALTAPPGLADTDASPEPEPSPWSVQAEALDALAAARAEGCATGMVVMATGLGKTWLAAFDSTRPEFRRTLFVAHREEILAQARDVFRRIRPDGRLSLLAGDERDLSGDVVFASVQSLHRRLDQIEPTAFDYVVIDEFHHADAPTYRKVIAHLQPRFLLGITATPERADAADLLALCSDNLVYECGLIEGIERGLLCPFVYRAIPDVADYTGIPWRSGRFDPVELTRRLETRRRALQVLDEWRARDGSTRRALGFCCSITHADFMAEVFREHGVPAVAVHSGPTSAPRHESLERLRRGEVRVIFTVDLFNEGVDVPAVDVVLMLRPTESPVVFFQQLGRGLRRAEGKAHLDVVDLVGNHHSFVLKARLLAELAGRSVLTDREAISTVEAGLTDLPTGCSIVVEPEVIDLFRSLAPARRGVDRLAELIDAWRSSHDDRRPTALELAVATGTAHDVKRFGGWFGALEHLGLLSEGERRVRVLAGDLLVDVEHGSYTKSFKLITWQVLLDAGRLRAGMPVRDVALGAWWRVQRDPRLRADLTDTASSFRQPGEPTPQEWEAYWRKNPINALIGGNRADGASWFRLDDDTLRLTLDVPADVADTFDAMVAELVEYRLHRYLVGRAARPQRPPREADGTATRAVADS